MRSNDETIKLLMISAHSNTAAMLRQLMEQQGLCGEIRRVTPGTGAIAIARGSSPRNGEPAADVVMLDFATPDEHAVSALQQVALGSPRLPAPVILLTSPNSEKLLCSGDVKFDGSRVFAPTSLRCFVRKMREHPRSRFLRALSVMADLGPILVRLPVSMAELSERRTALSA